MVLSTILAVCFALIVGAGFCFYGYRIFLVLLPVWGFFAGFWLGAQTIDLILGGGFLATTTGWVVGLVVGLILAVFSYMFYMLGVAVIAGIIGYGFGAGLMGVFGMDGFLAALVGILFGVLVVGVVLFFNIQEYVITFLTAFAGANAMTLGVLLLIGRVQLDTVRTAGSAIQPVLQDSLFWSILWAALGIAGLVYQIRANHEFEFDVDRYAEGWG